MTPPALPQWLDLVVSLLVLCGAAIALIGSWGLLTLPRFFSRVHAPAIIATMATWCIVHPTWLYFWLARDTPAPQVLLVALFVAITAPVTSIFLMRAALFRSRRAQALVPEPLGGTGAASDPAAQPGAGAYRVFGRAAQHEGAQHQAEQ